MVTINIISSDYFELNGKRFAKIYQPLAQGLESIGIYNVNDTRQQLLSSTNYSEFNINGIDNFNSQEEVINALLPVIFKFQQSSNSSVVVQWGQVTGNILNQTDLITLVNSTKPVQNTYNTLSEMLNDQLNQTNGFWQYVEDARTASEITNGDPVYNKYFEYLGLTNAAITDYRAIDDDEANGGNNNGLSAYEVAVENGFIGTETQWLDSLQGADGNDGQDGTNGNDGSDGSDGLSAYELAVQEGFVGTLTEWIQFIEGTDGADGVDGTDGLSAYEVAVNNGFSGTEQGWLDSLQGSDGSDGQDGTNGNDGSDGLSAYEVAVSNGFLGTEAEWLESLKASTNESDIYSDVFEGDTGSSIALDISYYRAFILNVSENTVMTLSTSGLSNSKSCSLTAIVSGNFTIDLTAFSIAPSSDSYDGSIDNRFIFDVYKKANGTLVQILTIENLS